MAMAMAETYIVVLGTPEAGKTSFIEKYITGELSTTYEPTAQHVFMKEIMFETKPLKLHVVDVGGAPPPEVDKDAIIKKADGIIIIFDVTKSDSFNAVKDIKKHVAEVIPDKNIPIILIGTKSDLEEREVTEAQGMELGKELNCMYFEASAINGNNIEAAFLKLISMIVDMRKKSMPAEKMNKKKKCCQLL